MLSASLEATAKVNRLKRGAQFMLNQFRADGPEPAKNVLRGKDLVKRKRHILDHLRSYYSRGEEVGVGRVQYLRLLITRYDMSHQRSRKQLPTKCTTTDIYHITEDETSVNRDWQASIS